MAPLYSEFHPAVSRLIEMGIKAARKRRVQTSICGQAGSNPKFVETATERSEGAATTKPED